MWYLQNRGDGKIDPPAQNGACVDPEARGGGGGGAGNHMLCRFLLTGSPLEPWKSIVFFVVGLMIPYLFWTRSLSLFFTSTVRQPTTFSGFRAAALLCCAKHRKTALRNLGRTSASRTKTKFSTLSFFS